MSCHEGDGLRGRQGGRPDEIGLIFATGIIRDDDKFAVSDIGYDFFNRTEGEFGHGEVGEKGQWWVVESVKI